MYCQLQRFYNVTAIVAFTGRIRIIFSYLPLTRSLARAQHRSQALQDRARPCATCCDAKVCFKSRRLSTWLSESGLVSSEHPSARFSYLRSHALQFLLGYNLAIAASLSFTPARLPQTVAEPWRMRRMRFRSRSPKSRFISHNSSIRDVSSVCVLETPSTRHALAAMTASAGAQCSASSAAMLCRPQRPQSPIQKPTRRHFPLHDHRHIGMPHDETRARLRQKAASTGNLVKGNA